MSPIEIQMLLGEILPFAVALAAIGMGGKIITTWISSRGGKALPAGELREISSRLADLQASVDTIAVEVERIEEAQRFNSRLLAESKGTVPGQRRLDG